MESRATEGDRVVVVSPYGELDIADAPALRAALLAACGRASGLVVLDLAAVTFLDSTILGVLVAARKRLQSDCRLVVVNAGPRVLKVMRLTGLDEALNVHALNDDLEVQVAEALIAI